MSSSALAALLGKKPAAPTAVTPVAPHAAVATPAPTAPPARAAAPLSPPPAAAPAAPPVAATAAASPAPGPNAVSAPTPEGSPPDTLAALLGAFTAAAGSAPRVNPPQAAAVLAGPTAAEVAGHPEPPEAPEEKVAPVGKPAEVLAAEQAPKSRRTAAVVQVELDAALARVAELEKAPTHDVTHSDPQNESVLAEAVAMIEALQAEAAVQLDDNRKAWARVAELEGQLDKAAPSDGLAFTPDGTLDLDAIDIMDLVSAVRDRLPDGVSITMGKR